MTCKMLIYNSYVRYLFGKIRGHSGRDTGLSPLFQPH